MPDFGSLDEFFGKIGPGALIGAAPLIAAELRGPSQLPAEKELQQQAGEAQSQARTLGAYQQSGTLPAGLQSVVDEQFNAAKAGLVNEYSKLGLGNSTALVEKLSQLRGAKSAEVAQLANKFAAQGIQWEKLSADELGAVLQAQQHQDSAFQNAVMSFARGLAGGIFKDSTSNV